MRERRLYAHRGAAAELPENTIPSFERALSHGAHALEMDVHATSDGEIVVSHDASGGRMCGVADVIRKTPYARVKHWDAGWGFEDASGQRPFLGKDFRIPRFAEVLEHFPDIQINVDLKQSSPSIVHSVLSIVRQAGAEHRVIPGSFSQRTVLHLRMAGYQGMTALGPLELGAALFTPSWFMRAWPYRGGAAQVPTKAGAITLASTSAIAKFHKLGVRVDFWTVNELDVARRLLAMGADGIMTDDPKAIAPAFDD